MIKEEVLIMKMLTLRGAYCWRSECVILSKRLVYTLRRTLREKVIRTRYALAEHSWSSEDIRTHPWKSRCAWLSTAIMHTLIQLRFVLKDEIMPFCPPTLLPFSAPIQTLTTMLRIGQIIISIGNSSTPIKVTNTCTIKAAPRVYVHKQ